MDLVMDSLQRWRTIALRERRRRLMNKPAPDYLFKYRSLRSGSAEFVKTLLVDRTIYLPTPSELNDPFECNLHVINSASPLKQKFVLNKMARRAGGTPEMQKRRARELDNFKGQALADHLKTTVDQLFKSTGIYSLAEKPDNLLMWAHYGDSHHGLCLRFKWDTLHAVGLTPLPVAYSEAKPVYDLAKDSDSATALLDKAILTKGSAWEYEAEWRSIAQKASGAIRLEVGLVDGIIFGARTTPEFKATVRSWADQCREDIDFFDARIDPATYRVRIQPA